MKEKKYVTKPSSKKSLIDVPRRARPAPLLVDSHTDINPSILKMFIEELLDRQNDLASIASRLGITEEDVRELIEKEYGLDADEICRRGHKRGISKLNCMIWDECEKGNVRCMQLLMQKHCSVDLTKTYAPLDSVIDLPDNGRLS